MTEEEIREEVKQLLLENIDNSYSILLGRRYFNIQPDTKKYPYQWFWDTCFHAFILSALGENDLAKLSIKSLFSLQKNDGFVGHVIFWKGVFPRYLLELLQSRP